MSDLDKEILAQLTTAATELGQVREQFSEVKERVGECRDEIRKLPCRDQSGVVPASCPTPYRASDPPPDAPSPRSPSALYRAVGVEIEEAAEEATGQIKYTALLEAQRAADDIAARTHVEKLREMELQHAAAMKDMELRDASRKSWLRIAVVALGLLGGGGGVAAVQAWLSSGERGAKVEQTLRRIEAKQQKPVVVRPPDAGAEP